MMIVGEVVQPIRHCLIARDLARALGDRDRRLPPPGQRPVRALHPHPAAAARACWPGSSTADAVRIVAEHDGPWAALGNRLAAERYGCLVLRAGVEDVADNETRFVWLARAGAAAGGPARAGSAARRWGRGRRRSCSGAWAPRRPAGSSRCLSEFAERGVNLTRIESRPRKQGLGRYMFFVDLEGHEDDAAVAAGLEGLRAPRRAAGVLGSLSRLPEPVPDAATSAVQASSRHR